MSDILHDRLVAEPRAMKWTRERYDRCVEEGIFGAEDRIELLDGEIFEMSPQHTPHAVALRLTIIALEKAFGTGFDVRCQMPLALDDLSEPEPDASVVSGSPRDYLRDHPSKAEIVIEISDSTLAYDRGRKLAAYARNGVPEYWIVNLLDRQIEIHRRPDAAASSYADQVIIRSGESIATLSEPDIPFLADDLLP